jgi:hypothetical protein
MQSVLASYGSDDESADTESTSKTKEEEEQREKLRAKAEKFDSLLNQAKKAVPRQVKALLQI